VGEERKEVWGESGGRRRGYRKDRGGGSREGVSVDGLWVGARC